MGKITDALANSRFTQAAKKLGFRIVERRDAVMVGLAARSGRLRLTGCRAEVVDVGTTGHVSAGRVVAGSVLAPGVGTIVGALAKKDRANFRVRLTDRDGATISVDTIDRAAAEWFAAEFNRRYADL